MQQITSLICIYLYILRKVGIFMKIVLEFLFKELLSLAIEYGVNWLILNDHIYILIIIVSFIVRCFVGTRDKK